MRTFKNIVWTAIFVFSALPLIAQNPDILHEPVSYDFILRQTLQGNIPASRFAVYPLSLKTLKKYDASTTDTAFKRYIYEYYAPLIDTTRTSDAIHIFDYDRGRLRGAWYADSLLKVQADLGGMLQATLFKRDENTSETIGLGRVSARVMGNYADLIEFYFDFSNGKQLIGGPETARIIDPFLKRSLKFNIEKQEYFDNYIGYVQAQYKDLRLRFGRENISHGYSPIDNLVFSLKAAPADGLVIDFPYKWLRFTTTHAAVEGTNYAPIEGTNIAKNEPVLSKFIATHRVAIDPAPWISFAFSEMMIYSGRGVDFSYLNPVAFLVSAGLGTTYRSNEDNSILGFDMAVRPFKNTMLYGALVADDINFSTLSDTTNLANDNKYAFQLGASYLVPDEILPLLATAEYVRITPFTFSHRRNQNSWTHYSQPLGYDMQPNSDRAALQLKYWISPRTSLKIDMDYTRHGENLLKPDGSIENVGGDILRGDGDFFTANRFLKGNVSHTRRIGGIFSAELFPNFFTDFSLYYESRNGGNAPLRQYWASLQARLGY